MVEAIISSLCNLPRYHHDKIRRQRAHSEISRKGKCLLCLTIPFLVIQYNYTKKTNMKCHLSRSLSKSAFNSTVPGNVYTNLSFIKIKLSKTIEIKAKCYFRHDLTHCFLIFENPHNLLLSSAHR